ncbi:hypothetical protein ACFL1Z_09590, partial [Thermodesulfobacteriota bacterium]
SDKIDEVFQNNPEDYKEELAKLGFQWCEDDGPDEIEEENQSIPQNENQKLLVAYFNGDTEFSNKVMDAFLKEKYCDEPNYALVRKYFRKGNDRLKDLICYGLEKDPVDIGFLSDLAFFHEFHPLLATLIKYYMEACKLQNNMEAFGELAYDFYCNTSIYGFDAYHALKDVFGPETEKGMIVEHLMQAEKEYKKPITF